MQSDAGCLQGERVDEKAAANAEPTGEAARRGRERL